MPYWTIFIADCVITLLAQLAVYSFYIGFDAAYDQHINLLGTMLFYLVFYAIGYYIFRTYKGIIRYSSFVDLQRVGLAVLFGMCCTIIIDQLPEVHKWLINIRIRDIVLGSTLTLLLIWAERIMIKYLYDSYFVRRGATRVFIYGVHQGGISLAKSLRSQDPATYELVGFLSDEPDMIGRMLMGKKVYSIYDNLIENIKKHDVKGVFISPLRSDAFRKNDQTVNALIEAGIKIYMVPHEQEWDGKSNLSHSVLHEVDIEDLLPRDKIEVDMESIGRDIDGKTIMITGAAGSIGSEIVRQVSEYKPKSLVLIDQAETPLHDIRLMMARKYPSITAYTLVANISNEARMRKIFEEHRPDYVYHAAAYKHVPMMEDNPVESITNNINGSRIVADLSVEFGVKKFVMVSTDKAVNPTNVMGCSKRICEIYVQSLNNAIKDKRIEGVTRFVTTRFGNVLGSNGSVIPLFKEQIRQGGPLTVTHPDIIRYFMLIPEACKLVLEAGTMGQGGEIFVFDMGEPVKIVDLAKRMIKLSGANIDIKFTGLRDGEKLYEEVLNEKETTLPTPHPKVKVAKVRKYDYEAVKIEIQEMIDNAPNETPMQIVARMKQLVPEFKSQHSVYEILDKKES